MPLRLNNDTEYVNSTDYKVLGNRLTDLKSTLEDMTDKLCASRKLRYSEVDIEVEREAGRLQPDEVYIPQHVIDTNIRREQPFYIQFVTQSPRAVIVSNSDNPAADMSLLEKDLTEKIRYPGWQTTTFANVDGFQANGYGIMETVYDVKKPGSIKREYVQYGDFAFVADTRDLQSVEMVAREYHYTKTELLDLCGDDVDEDERWDKDQVYKIIGKDSAASVSDPGDATDSRDKSLYRVQKIQFKVKGIVQVAWSCIGTCDNWARKPRPLYLGRRQLTPENQLQKLMRTVTGNQVPPSTAQFETEFPYFLYPYLISENDTISHLKGRIFLDQDAQEAACSLLSSILTQSRRAAGLYGSKDVSDPNDDIFAQKNIFLRSGCVLNSKVSFVNLPAPDPGMFSALQTLMVSNQNETTNVSFAAKNRKDSRKTAKEMEVSEDQTQTLSSIQVILYSIGLCSQYRYECDIIRSRVLAGLIKVRPEVMAQYQMNYTIKPSGDVDVIEKQQMIQLMMNVWPVVQNTPAAMIFLSDLLEKMFPDNAAKYIATFQQAQQQQSSQQNQQMQQFLQIAKATSDSLVELSKHPEMFSETGRIHAFPLVKAGADKLQAVEQQMTQGQGQGQQKK